MENLAGTRDCDSKIEGELRRCGIEVVRRKRADRDEVPASITGKLGSLTFYRAWSYWVAVGNVPLRIAQEIYKEAVGKTDIRAGGDCGHILEGYVIEWRDKAGRKLYPLSEKCELEKYGDNPITREVLNNQFISFVKDPSVEGEGFVTLYHIDSEKGLRLFADTLKKHGLV